MTSGPIGAEPFEIAVSPERLADLEARLRVARLPPATGSGWDYGMDTDYLGELVAYWRDEFDWRRQEAAMNKFDHYRVEIDGVPIHFLHRPGVGPAPTPLVLIHGWPWTFWDFEEMIEPLANPAAYGGDPADAFDVIVPSLPGYAFSNPVPGPGRSAWEVADLFVELLEKHLGHKRFAVHGGDMGAQVAGQLGHKYPERLIGLHLAPRPLRLDTFNVKRPWLLFGAGGDDETIDWEATKVGHVVAQTIAPQTLAVAMHDSPVGLAAWLLERRRAWSDCGGDVEKAFSKDFLLTNFSLFWLTDSFAPAAWQYRDNWVRGWTPSHDRTPVVEAPTGITLFRADAPVAGDWFDEYFDLRFLTESTEGGHFAAAEQPQRLVSDLQAFLRPLR
jgi:pimeloyl-ACP methyl ester carboxylesterase